MSLSRAASAAASHFLPQKWHALRMVGAILTLGALGACASSVAGPIPDAPEKTKAERAIGREGDTYLIIGKRLIDAGEYDLAIDAFERSILIEGVSAAAMTGAGIAAEKRGLISMASRYFERARELAPESELANNNLGVVLYRLREYYRARQAFQAAFALSDGRNELALRNLRLTERIIKDIEAGRRYVDPALNMEVRRLGSSEFELIDYEPPELDYQIGEPEQPAEGETIPDGEEIPPGT